MRKIANYESQEDFTSYLPFQIVEVQENGIKTVIYRFSRDEYETFVYILGMLQNEIHLADLAECL